MLGWLSPSIRRTSRSAPESSALLRRSSGTAFTTLRHHSFPVCRSATCAAATRVSLERPLSCPARGVPRAPSRSSPSLYGGHSGTGPPAPGPAPSPTLERGRGLAPVLRFLAWPSPSRVSAFSMPAMPLLRDAPEPTLVAVRRQLSPRDPRSRGWGPRSQQVGSCQGPAHQCIQPSRSPHGADRCREGDHGRVCTSHVAICQSPPSCLPQ